MTYPHEEPLESVAEILLAERVMRLTSEIVMVASTLRMVALGGILTHQAAAQLLIALVANGSIDQSFLKDIDLRGVSRHAHN